MAFDFKKEYKEFYLPKRTPELVSVPPMTFVAVRGEGDPNVEGGAYKEAVGVLYAIAYTIKMSKMGDHRIGGLLVATGRGRRRLREQGDVPLDCGHSPARLRDA